MQTPDPRALVDLSQPIIAVATDGKVCSGVISSAEALLDRYATAIRAIPSGAV